MTWWRWGAGACWLVLGVLVSWLLAAVLAGVGVAPSAQAPPPGPRPPDGPVVVLGVPGLTWDLVDPDVMPEVSRLAREGGAAALVLRGAHETTCTADAWLTLGAGQRAATDVQGCVDAEPGATPTTGRPSPVLAEDVVVAQGQGAVVSPDVWERWSREADRRSLAAEPGTLAAQVTASGSCVAAYDPLAALGAADPEGRVASYRPGPGTRGHTLADPGEVPQLPADLEATCDVHLMTTAAVGQGADRGAVDRSVGALVEGLPDGATVLVTGLGHLDGRPEATVLVAHPVGAVAAEADAGSTADAGGAALTSGSTQQRGLVQLTDLTATVLRLAGAGSTVPEAVAGAPVVAVGHRGGEDHVGAARDLAAGISLAKAGAPWVLGAVGVALLPLLVVTALRRGGRRAAGGGTGGLPVVATAVLAVPVATFLAGLAPWWRTVSPVVALGGVVLLLVGLLTGLAWTGPWRRDPLGPAAVVAAVTLAAVGVDVICSARLGLVSVLGLQPVTAGRFYGQGNVGFGIFLGSFLVLAAAVVGRAPPPASPPDRPGRRRWPAVAVLALGAGAVVLNAAPQAGADFGGVPALVVATGLMVLAALRVPWSAGSLVLLALVGVGVAGGVMVLDWLRGPGRRTHLGEFVDRVLDGTALQIVARKLEQSLGILLAYPFSWLAVIALVLLAVLVWRRPGWAAPLWQHEGMHRALTAGVVSMTLGWVLNDSGIAVVALALTVLLAASLTLLGAPRGTTTQDR